MAPRPTWKGVLKISLVTIPIKVFPATDSADTISFNQLHAPDAPAHTPCRIQQKTWCPSCDRQVTANELTKGYEFEKGRYVLFQDGELEAVKPESTRVIDLVQFADASAVDPLYIQRSYYLAPDGPTAAEAFVVMSAALVGHVGIGKLAIYGREYLVMVRVPPGTAPLQPAVMLHTLHHAAEIRAWEADDLPSYTRVPPDQLTLARQVIASMTGPLDLVTFQDAYQADVRRLIDAKIAGDEFVMPRVDTPAVGNLREALRRSLDLVSAAKKPAAKASPAKRKRAS